MESKCFAMNTEHVSPKIYFLIECFAANTANERPLLGVDKAVPLQVRVTVGFILTHVAGEFEVFLGMSLKMLLEVIGAVAFVVAKCALKTKHKFFLVHFQVTQIFSFSKKRQIAVGTKENIFGA